MSSDSEQLRHVLAPRSSFGFANATRTQSRMGSHAVKPKDSQVRIRPLVACNPYNLASCLERVREDT